MSALPANFEILLDEAKGEQELQAPCPPERLEALRERARQELACDLPVGYLNLLAVANGFVGFGLMVYADADDYAGGGAIIGFFTANEDYRHDFPDRVFFAEMGDDLLAWDATSGSFLNQDRETGDVNERYASFEEMLDNIAASLLE